MVIWLFGTRFIHSSVHALKEMPRRLMASTNGRTYEEAIAALNGLQSNAANIEKARKEKRVVYHKNISDMAIHLKMLGIEVEDLDKLRLIHVAGTKGKGSTCAFTESILRSHGLKTGFFSSPHLVAARERIRINGIPLSKALFTMYFWEVFTKLKENETKNGVRMPAYFMFLTAMAFHVFIKEKTDVAVIEVGIGGAFDSTNVIRNPYAVGITSLGIDHTNILGTTVQQIAWQKAGIFKHGVPAFTVPQPDGAYTVLQDQAREIGCSLKIAPSLITYEWEKFPVLLGIPGDAQSINASLALQLSKTWLERYLKPTIPTSRPDANHGPCMLIAEPFIIPEEMAAGLQNCTWPGRCQVVHREGITYYLDGAHTEDSIAICYRWFKEASAKERNLLRKDVCQILLFNCTGDRKVELLLSPLVEHPFDFALFCPNNVGMTKSFTSDQSNFTVNRDVELNRCKTNMRIWCHLVHSLLEEGYFSEDDCHLWVPENKCLLFNCISDAFSWMNKEPKSHQMEINGNGFPHCGQKSQHIQVLVTGSLHLVGGFMSVIDPDLALQEPKEPLSLKNAK